MAGMRRRHLRSLRRAFGRLQYRQPEMRFAYWNGNTYVVVRITGNGSPGSDDTFGWGTTPSLAEAIAWVNRGVKGSHIAASWTWLSISQGNYQVHAPN